MKYLMLIHQGSTPTPYSDDWDSVDEETKQSIYRDYQELNENPKVTPGMQLQPPETATTVRVENDETLTTDGPFVAVKEALGGYLVFDGDDLDEAIDVASRIPAARMGGAIEIRPIGSWS